MFPWWAWAIAACWRSRAALAAENLCLRQQLLVLRRRQLRPRLSDEDRRFWILASRWFPGWQDILVVVSVATVLRWHHRGWRTYWRWRSRRGAKAGRHPIAQELQALIRRMTIENQLGVSGGSRRSWRGSGSKFRPGRSPSTCIAPIIAGRRHAGDHS
jgi:hypothetical protein